MFRPDSQASAVVIEFFKILSGGDRAAYETLLHPDIHVDIPASIPYGGEFHGLDDMRARFFRPYLAARARVRFAFAVTDLRTAGDRVMAAFDMLLTARASGRRLRTSEIILFNVVDGLVHRIDSYPKDSHRMAQFFLEAGCYRPDALTGLLGDVHGIHRQSADVPDPRRADDRP